MCSFIREGPHGRHLVSRAQGGVDSEVVNLGELVGRRTDVHSCEKVRVRIGPHKGRGFHDAWQEDVELILTDWAGVDETMNRPS